MCWCVVLGLLVAWCLVPVLVLVLALSQYRHQCWHSVLGCRWLCQGGALYSPQGIVSAA